MPMYGIEGLTCTRKNTNVRWKIPEFSHISLEEDNYLESPPFEFLDRSWCLRFYPNGDSESVGWFAVYLVNQDLKYARIPMILKIALRFEFDDQEIEPKAETGEFMEFSKIYKRTNIFRAASFRRYSSHTFDMTIICVVTEKLFSPHKFCSDFDNLSKSFGKLLGSEHEADVTFEVKGHKFKAHKVVLYARSPVFSDKFLHERREKTDDIIKIDDWEPNVFKNFLNFAYSGRINRSLGNLKSLDKMADRYSFTALKVELGADMEKLS